VATTVRFAMFRHASVLSAAVEYVGEHGATVIHPSATG
jgi:hypothetical protein